MDESKQLRNPVPIRREPELKGCGVRWRTKPKLDRAVRLGDTLSELMENRISPRYARYSSVIELWGRLLPAELSRHCKLADISEGQLKVLVDSPSHMHELRLCNSELLGELQKQCPKARIRKIKFVIG